jgi:hypothetical protein
MRIPSSLWPVLQQVATGGTWPPSTVEEARAFLEEAKLQFLLPLLFRDDSLPPIVVDLLPSYRAIERLSAARAAIIDQELRWLCDLLSSEEIILVKGTDYGHRLYDHPTLRPMADIDILVTRERMPSVSARLEHAGLSRSYIGGPTYRPASAYERVYLSERAMIEVHHSFIQRQRTTIDYDAVWKRRVPMEGFPPRVFRLDDVDALTYHALTLAIKEFEGRLIRDLDFWLLLRWAPDALMPAAHRAREWSCRHALFGALTFAAALFPDLRSEQLDAVTWSLVGRRRGRFLLDHVFPEPTARRYASKPGRLIQLWRKFWLMDSMTRRTAFFVHHAYLNVAGRIVAVRAS